MTRAATICVPLLLLAACGPQLVWHKPGTTEAEYQRDVTWCDGEGDLAVGYLDDRWRMLAQQTYTDAYNRCMASRGWTLTTAPPPR